MTKVRLNLGAGTNRIDDFINVDIAPLPGIDLICNLEDGLPFREGVVSQVVMINVLEHLLNITIFLEDLWRVCANGALITIRVPFWNSIDFAIDPTHRKGFHFSSFDFYDPARKLGREREYYSQAKFSIRQVSAYVWMGRYFKIRNRYVIGVLRFVSSYICNIVRVLEFDLVAIKDYGGTK